MGLNFRKSIKLPGGIRVNLSKKGVGVSAGVKGFRVSATADGKVQATTSIPGTGIYSRETVGHIKNPSKTPQADNASEGKTPAQQISERLRQESYELNKPRPFTHIRFIATETKSKEWQEVLYLFKMRRPPFDKDLTLSLVEDDSTPERIGICIKDSLVGYVPADEAAHLSQIWDQIDAVSWLEVLGAKGKYDAQVTVRINKDPAEYEAELAEYDANFK